MEVEENAPNTTADPVCMGRKSRRYSYNPVLKYSCTGMTFLLVQTGSAVCIWRTILVFHLALLSTVYATYLSIFFSEQL